MKIIFYLLFLNSLISISQTTYLEKSNEYFESAELKHDSKDYSGAIEDYTKAILLNPNDAQHYNFRGISKHELQDYKGAIEDYTKAIEINPNYDYA